MILKKFNKEKYFCGLDLGAQRIKVSLIRAKDGQQELAGVYETDTHGFKDGAVSDLAELSECVHTAVGKLTQKTAMAFKEVHLGIDADLIEVRQTDTVIPLVDRGNKVISHRDIQKINKQARLLGVKVEEEILHNLPQRYLIDDHSSALNPQGLYGRKLGVRSLLIVTDGNRVRNVIKAVNQAGYDVGSVFFASLSSSEIALTPQDKKEGCALVDIGAAMTSVLFFKEGVLCFVDKVRSGGSNFTNRIAKELNLPLNLAEDIKKSYAVAIRSENEDQEEILVKRENAYIPIRKEVIYNSIEPEIDRLVDNISGVISSSNYAHQLDRGIVMVGGGALLPGLMERVSQASRLDVRLGTINAMTQTSISNAAIYSGVIGLAYGGFVKTLKDRHASNGQAGWSKKMADKIRELYQEYF